MINLASLERLSNIRQVVLSLDVNAIAGSAIASLEEIKACLEEVGVEVHEGMTNERKNITQPSDWWAAFEEAAKAEGMTLAAWLGEAAKAKLPPKVVKKLTERPPANRPPKAKD